MPRGASDCHAHVIGSPEHYPFTAERSYTPPPAPEEAYLAMHRALGIERGVLVQVSVHGTDNRLLVETLRHHPERLRGIAVVAPDVADAELDVLDAAGVRGLRCNELFGGGIGLEAMESLARRIARRGWHLQLLIDGRRLPIISARLVGLPVPFVVDHMGYIPTAGGLDDPGFQELCKLLKEADCWVKISGANRIASEPGRKTSRRHHGHADRRRRQAYIRAQIRRRCRHCAAILERHARAGITVSTMCLLAPLRLFPILSAAYPLRGHIRYGERS